MNIWTSGYHGFKSTGLPVGFFRGDHLNCSRDVRRAHCDLFCRGCSSLRETQETQSERSEMAERAERSERPASPREWHLLLAPHVREETVQKATVLLDHLPSDRAVEIARMAEEEAFWQADSYNIYCMLIAEKTNPTLKNQVIEQT